MPHLIGKEFVANGVERATGEVVKTASWPERRVRQLEDQRFIHRIQGQFEAVTCRCGRGWADEETMRKNGHEFEEGDEERYRELKVLSRDALLDEARELGIPEEDIDGTGSNGYVKRSDIIQAILSNED